MSNPIHLRLMTPQDVPFADQLRDLAGWNQTVEDWRRFLALAPEGCFIAEWNGSPAGTATTTVYSPDLAWIGMVLVHPDYRQRGIGRALLTRCISCLQAQSVRCLKLDATPAGLPLYQSLGFETEWALTRWEFTGASPTAGRPASALRTLTKGDLATIASLDAKAFGVSRQPLLAHLIDQSIAAYAADAAGKPEAAGLLRRGSKASQLGPVFGNSISALERVGQALVERNASPRIFCDVPDLNTAATAWAQRNGFQVQRRLTRMFLGRNLFPGDPQKQFALSGPDIG